MVRIQTTIILFILLVNAPAFADFVVHPYLQPDEGLPTSVAVHWITNGNAESYVDFGMTSAYGRTAGSSTPVNEHTVVLRNLQADTVYHYRVRSGSDVSPDASFRTLSLDPTKPFRFLAYGDTRSGPDAHERVCNLISSLVPEPRFILHSGDLIASGEERYDWYQQLFYPARNLYNKIIMFSSAGNHEYEDGTIFDSLPHEWFDFLSLPNNERWYSFDYGNAHFVALDACVYDGANPIDIVPQNNWLRNDLASTTADWKFVFFHQPPYAKGSHDSQLLVRAAWAPIFDQYDVDIVFNGHNHYYQRTYPLRNGMATSLQTGGYTANDGTIYLVTGCGGVGPSTAESAWFVAAMDNCRHVTVLDVNGRFLSVQAIAEDGTLIETFTIDKRTPAPIPTATPTNTNTPRPTPTFTDIPTSTPEPTNTATPEPTFTERPTETPLPTQSPTLTPSRKPVIRMAGYMQSDLSRRGGTFLMYALAEVEPPEQITDVEILINGNPTDLRLNGQGSGVYQLGPFDFQGGMPQMLLLEVVARAGLVESNFWPYLTVE